MHNDNGNGKFNGSSFIGPSNTGGVQYRDVELCPYRAMKTSSQESFLLIDVRSDEKTVRRAVILARNADKHGRSRDARPKPFF